VTIRRLEDERSTHPLRRVALRRAGSQIVPLEELPAPLLALRYSNGFVTVEVSYDALERFIELSGDVPLPVNVDAETGDRKAYDATRGVRVIYDRFLRLREVTSQSRDGLVIRVNFPSRHGEAVAV